MVLPGAFGSRHGPFAPRYIAFASIHSRRQRPGDYSPRLSKRPAASTDPGGWGSAIRLRLLIGFQALLQLLQRVLRGAEFAQQFIPRNGCLDVP